jgi:hypothetical protein
MGNGELNEVNEHESRMISAQKLLGALAATEKRLKEDSDRKYETDLKYRERVDGFLAGYRYEFEQLEKAGTDVSEKVLDSFAEQAQIIHPSTEEEDVL